MFIPKTGEMIQLNEHIFQMDHHAFDVVGGIDSSKITIGLDWHKVISSWCVDKYNHPAPLFVLQLRELAEEFDIQYWVVSFTGWSGAQAAKEDISEFVATCVSVHGLPFCGFRVWFNHQLGCNFHSWKKDLSAKSEVVDCQGSYY